ncbi:MAG TPA: tail fiber domain-containing protein, partial [Candidatus Scalindua sp.]|nr:tail fiber domain-containing protein [Candidatus Scalindua sp.]
AALTGSGNTHMGYFAGSNQTSATGTIKLGKQAGQNSNVSNLLFIDNSNTATPLIWGDFAADSVIINGDLRATGYSGGANAWTNESDRRLKKNIEPIDNALSKVLRLQGVEFDWRDDRRKRSVGFIAQDVASVIPEVVDAGETYSMQTSQITAVLVEAVKEQQRQIRTLFVIVLFLVIIIGVLWFRKSKIKYLAVE